MMLRIVQNLLVLLAIVVSQGVYAGEERKGCVSESDLKLFFDSVVAEGTNCVFTFKKTGARFVYSINGQGYKVNEYGESVVLGNDSELKICERHLDVSFSLLPRREGEVGFLVALRKDYRSMQGGVATNYAHLVTAKELTNRIAEPKGRCLSGLKLVPVD